MSCQRTAAAFTHSIGRQCLYDLCVCPSLPSLPLADVLQSVMGFLDARSLSHLEATSRDMRILVKFGHVWKRAFLRDFRASFRKSVAALVCVWQPVCAV